MLESGGIYIGLEEGKAEGPEKQINTKKNQKEPEFPMQSTPLGKSREIFIGILRFNEMAQSTAT
jgi:hypothetical protein